MNDPQTHRLLEVPAAVEDHDTARTHLAKACDHRFPDGCIVLGIARVKGQLGAEVDRNAAAELFDRACRMGHPAGCFEQGVLRLDVKDDVSAFELFQRACAGGEARGCHNAELMKRDGRGQ